ncbi:MAG: RecX family transcriptional regulator [Flavobacteriales bacterium]|nr:RecX family transcriptional regulator [Flavobacteriales bacterium]
MSFQIKNMPYEKALEKAKWYCSFQERCILDVENRFLAWKVKREEWDKLLDVLLEQDFLNEDRYVEDFVRGKFSIKKWGRLKIKAELLKKKIKSKKVEEELAKIDEENYHKTIQHLLEKKKELLPKIEDELKLRDKLYRYLISKGYESELVVKELNTI